jgi:predicted small metal-binding protein
MRAYSYTWPSNLRGMTGLVCSSVGTAMAFRYQCDQDENLAAPLTAHAKAFWQLCDYEGEL